MFHRFFLTSTALALAIASPQLSAQARHAAPEPSATTASAIDPAAVKALNAMAAYLRSLKTFRVRSATTTDDVMDDGQVVQTSAIVNSVVQMPNKLLVDVTSDRKQRRFIYDGHTFTLWAARLGYYASAPAPPTLRELDDLLSSKFNIELPLADLFRFGSPNWTGGDITGAADIGASNVDDTTCEQYAFRQEGIDWQVWIQKGEYPLPRQLVITTLTDPARPRFRAVYTWDLAPSFSEGTFTFVPPANARKIVLAPQGER